MHNLDLILTLTGGLAAALILGYWTHRLGLSPIVGYLLAGLVVGPNTPGFVADRHLAEQLAEVGVVLLMFGVGLQFHLKELLEVLPGRNSRRRLPDPGSHTPWLSGCERAWLELADRDSVRCGHLGGQHRCSCACADRQQRPAHTQRPHRRWLARCGRPLYRSCSSLASCHFWSGRTSYIGFSAAIALAVLKLGALVVFTLFVGGRVIPWLLNKIAATRSRELFTLTILVLALGIAVGSAKLFSASMALGAFLAGMVVGRSDFSLRAASEALPMRDAFAVLFFVSVGMLFDPKHLIESPGLTASTLAIVMLGKPLSALAIVLMLKYPLRVALSVAVALAQIGEFSFILAAVGKQLGLLPDPANNALVAVAIVSITLNPLLYGFVDALESRIGRYPRLWSRLSARKSIHSEDSSIAAKDGINPSVPRALVVGYGPVGQLLTRLLRESEIEPTVVELNLDTVRRLRTEGILAIYGDASRSETLKKAGIESALSLILSAAGMPGGAEAIRLAKEANPRIRVFAPCI